MLYVIETQAESGRVRVQAFEPGRDVIGPEVEVSAPYMVEIPAHDPVSPAREVSPSEANSVLRRIGRAAN